MDYAYSPQKLEQLRAARDDALEDGRDVVVVNGQIRSVKYLRYLIEWLDFIFHRKAIK